MPKQRLLVVALLLLLPASRLHAQSADSADAVAAVHRLLDAMARADTSTARAVLAPGAQLVAAGSEGRPTRTQSDTAFLRALAAPGRKLLERIWAPVVQVRGPLAVVWAPYDFHINGEFSHCGVDAFTLVREQATWRVIGISYTVERNGCAASPLGPPRE